MSEIRVPKGMVTAAYESLLQTGISTRPLGLPEWEKVEDMLEAALIWQRDHAPIEMREEV